MPTARHDVRHWRNIYFKHWYNTIAKMILKSDNITECKETQAVRAGEGGRRANCKKARLQSWIKRAWEIHRFFKVICFWMKKSFCDVVLYNDIYIAYIQMLVRMLAVHCDQNNYYEITMKGYQVRKINEIKNVIFGLRYGKPSSALRPKLGCSPSWVLNGI